MPDYQDISILQDHLIELLLSHQQVPVTYHQLPVKYQQLPPVKHEVACLMSEYDKNYEIAYNYDKQTAKYGLFIVTIYHFIILSN